MTTPIKMDIFGSNNARVGEGRTLSDMQLYNWISYEQVGGTAPTHFLISLQKTEESPSFEKDLLSYCREMTLTLDTAIANGLDTKSVDHYTIMVWDYAKEYYYKHSCPITK
jgi:hypothetical protein